MEALDSLAFPSLSSSVWMPVLINNLCEVFKELTQVIPATYMIELCPGEILVDNKRFLQK